MSLLFKLRAVNIPTLRAALNFIATQFQRFGIWRQDINAASGLTNVTKVTKQLYFDRLCWMHILNHDLFGAARNTVGTEVGGEFDMTFCVRGCTIRQRLNQDKHSRRDRRWKAGIAQPVVQTFCVSRSVLCSVLGRIELHHASCFSRLAMVHRDHSIWHNTGIQFCHGFRRYPEVSAL